MLCGDCPVATKNPKDEMDCYFCPFDKADAFHSMHECSHIFELKKQINDDARNVLGFKGEP